MPNLPHLSLQAAVDATVASRTAIQQAAADAKAEADKPQPLQVGTIPEMGRQFGDE